MSDQERDQLAKETDEESTEDVEAHKHGTLGATDDDDGDDDVEAHKHATNG